MGARGQQAGGDDEEEEEQQQRGLGAPEETVRGLHRIVASSPRVRANDRPLLCR